jgi:hypothetical protein
MFKIGKKAYSNLYWGKGDGRVVEIHTSKPTDTQPEGRVDVFIGIRLSTERMGSRRTFQGILGWIGEFRAKRLLVTHFVLRPSTAVLLRDALNDVLKESELTKVQEP